MSTIDAKTETDAMVEPSPKAAATAEESPDFAGRLKVFVTEWISERLGRWFALRGPFGYFVMLVIGALIQPLGSAALQAAPAIFRDAQRWVGEHWLLRKADANTFAVVVMQLDGDTDGQIADRIAQELQKNLGHGVDVIVEPPILEKLWDDSDNGSYDKIESQVAATGASVLVWGKWSDDGYDIRMVTNRDIPDAQKWKADVPVAEIHIPKNAFAEDSGRDVSSVSLVDAGILAKALQSAWEAYGNGTQAGQDLGPVVMTLLRLVDRVSTSERLPIEDKVTFVTQFEQLCLTYDLSSPNRVGPLRDYAIPALQNVLKDPRLAAPSEGAELVLAAEDLGNALTEVARQETDHDYRLYEHDLAIKALNVAAKGAGARADILALTGTPKDWPAGTTVLTIATAQLDLANALEALGETNTFGDSIYTQLGEQDLEQALAMHQKAIETLKSYRPIRPVERFVAARPDQEVEDWNHHYELRWAQAQYMLALDIVKIAKLPAHSLGHTIDYAQAFEALGNALLIRRKTISESDWGGTLSLIGETYQARGTNLQSAADLRRAHLCFAQAESAIDLNNPNGDFWDPKYDAIVRGLIDKRAHNDQGKDRSDPPANWQCAPPTARQNH